MQKLAIFIVIIILVAGGFWYFNQRSTPVVQEITDTNQPLNENIPVNTNQPSEQATSTDQVAGTVKEFTVEGSNFKFSPNMIKVAKGDTVRVTFKNIGGFHDFVLDEFNIRMAQIGDGQQETVEFVANQTGSFEFYCSVGQHRQMGMVGTLIVE